MEACLIVTYRCNARCYMCNTWQHPSKKDEEFKPELVEKIPGDLKFLNITGGEPFLRDDLDEIIEIALQKTRRLVISTNGYFTEKIINLVKKFNNRVGIRISIEGLPAANDELRGIKNGFDHGLRTLLKLHSMGLKDIGFGITVSDRNAKDMIELYWLANAMGVEFATATTHNSYYFHKKDNAFQDAQMIAKEFEKIALELLKTNRPKNWFRAYFNMGLANKVLGGKRPLPCEVGTDVFFLDPYGNVMPCNGSDEPMIMGNLNKKSFNEIWHSEQADKIRARVKSCPKECWMIGSASPAIKKRIWIPALWIIKNKLKVIKNKGQNVCLDPVGRRR
ncbi:radical SAM/SPASM domain-containing protein [Desulfovulcanus sp.]